jgi:hypothetical protein
MIASARTEPSRYVVATASEAMKFCVTVLGVSDRHIGDMSRPDVIPRLVAAGRVVLHP